MNYVYARVSTTDKGQTNERQKYVIEGMAGVPKIDKIFEEKISGTKAALNRPVFKKMCKEIKDGDTIYFESLSRLGRSLEDLIDTVNYLTKERKVNLIFVKENIRMLVEGQGLDAIGSLIFNIMASLSQFERDLLSMRVKESLASKKAKGVRLGRKRQEVSADVKSKIVELYDSCSTVELMSIVGLKKNTLFKIIKELASEGKIVMKKARV